MTVVDLYTVQIIDTGGPYASDQGLAVPAEIIAELEENLTDLLPDGYHAKIRRWNDPDPDDEGNDDE